MPFGVVSLVLVLLAALLTPTASATADGHRLEDRLMNDFFVKNQVSSASTGAFPACADAFAFGEVLEVDPDTRLPKANYRSCAGEVRTFDGLELDARVTFPVGKSGPLPLVLLMHGWAGNRNGVHGTAAGHPGNDPANLLAAARFWQKGYATLAYTARGFYASCGALDPAADVHAAGGSDVPSVDGCHPRGHTHIAERDFEVADSQHLLGLLVDAVVADPQRLAATGASYGGGQSWLLATAMPWTTPKKTTIQLAAAAPLYGWTDLYGSLAPNGRATDRGDQSASHEEPNGVVKQRYVGEVYNAGRALPPVPPQPPDCWIANLTPTSCARPPDPLAVIGAGKYNSTYPDELHSFFDGWMEVFNAGEPHATPQARALPAAFRGKSAYHSVPRSVDPLGDPRTT